MNYKKMEHRKKNKYFAFISYCHEDIEWATWFQHEIEYYHLPSSLDHRQDLPKEFRPVFRDLDELKAGNLPKQINEALSQSSNLVVICSPKSAKSNWVNKEINEFIEVGKRKKINNIDHIFPFIVEGVPHSNNTENECFPKTLLELPKEIERIGGTVNEGSRDKAFVKVMAGMLPNVEFDELWNRYEQDKAKEERLKREERDKFLRIQSRLVAEKAIDIKHNSILTRSVVYEIIPKDLNNPERPFTIEAEKALRYSTSKFELQLRGHNLTVNDLSFNSDGRRLVSISDDMTIRIWDTETGSAIKVLNSKHPFGRCVRYSPDDKSIIAVYGDGTLQIWDSSTGELLTEISLAELFNTDHLTGIFSMAINTDGNKVAISTCDGDIFLITICENGDIDCMSLQTEPVHSVNFSPIGNYLVSTSDCGLSVWSLDDDSRGDLNIKDDVIIENAFAKFNSKGDSVVFFFNNSIGLLDMINGNGAQEFGYNQSKFVAANFCDDGVHIVSVTEAGEMTLWNIKKGQAVYTSYCNYEKVNRVCFCAKRNRIGLVIDRKTIIIKDIPASSVYRLITEENGPIETISYSPDGVHFATGGGTFEMGSLTIWDAIRGKIVKQLTRHSDTLRYISYNCDGSRLVSTSDNIICVWDTNTWFCIRTLDSIKANNDLAFFSSASFNPENTRIVVSLRNGTIIIWDYTSDTIIREIKKCNMGIVFDAKYSPDGSKIVSCGLAPYLQIWEADTGNKIMDLKGHNGPINSISFSPNGKQVASASDDKSIICWDIELGTLVWRVSGFQGIIQSVSYSNNGKYIVVVVQDKANNIVVCETTKGEKVATYTGHTETSNCAKFSFDDKLIVSAGSDGTIINWHFPSIQELINIVSEQVKKRPLTKEERIQYYLE